MRDKVGCKMRAKNKIVVTESEREKKGNKNLVSVAITITNKPTNQSDDILITKLSFRAVPHSLRFQPFPNVKNVR